MALYSLALLLAAPLIARAFFGGGPEAEIAVSTLRIIAVALPFTGVGIMLDMTCSGAGETRVPMIFNTFHTWVLQVPGFYILARVLEMPITALWWMIVVASALPPMVFWLYFRTRHWMRRTV